MAAEGHAKKPAAVGAAAAAFTDVVQRAAGKLLSWKKGGSYDERTS